MIYIIYIIYTYTYVYVFNSRAENILNVNIYHTDRYYISMYCAFYRYEMILGYVTVT